MDATVLYMGQAFSDRAGFVLHDKFIPPLSVQSLNSAQSLIADPLPAGGEADYLQDAHGCQLCRAPERTGMLHHSPFDSNLPRRMAGARPADRRSGTLCVDRLRGAARSGKRDTAIVHRTVFYYSL